MLREPFSFIEEQQMRLDYSVKNLQTAFGTTVSCEQNRLSAAAAKLDALSPLKVLGRGYAITRKGENVVHSVKDVSSGDRLTVRLSDGELPVVAE